MVGETLGKTLKNSHLSRNASFDCGHVSFNDYDHMG